MTYLVDTHCHLIFEDFKDDLHEVISNAFDSGVKGMVVISTQEKEFQPILALTEEYDNIFCSIGIHPHSSEEHKDISKEKILNLSKNDKVIGIGETGLDFYYENSNKEIQRDLFRKHISVSRETQLPIIIHTRDADSETIEILQEESQIGAFPGIIHCFTAGSELAKVAIELGFYISLSGIVTFKNASDLRETIKDIPLNRLLVETDSPYLSPEPVRGKRNEPSNVVHTANFLSNFFNIKKDEFYNKTTDNFHNVFKKASLRNE